MKRLLLTFSAMAIAFSSMASQPMVKPGPRGNSIYGIVNKESKGQKFMRTEDEVTLDDLLADPEGTVFSGPFDSETAAFTGFQNSD